MMEIFLFSIFIIIMLLILIGLYFARIIVYPRRFGVKETYDLEKESGKLVEADYNAWKKEEVTIESDFGYQIRGLLFPLDGAKKTIILSHGITYTMYGSVKYMKVFRDLGFNVYIYDHRYHGQSGGNNCTFGYYEKYDLKKIVTWVLDKTGKDSIIGTHGESMGAAISLQHAAIDDRVRFIVSDCSFNDLQAQLAYRLKIEYHLGRFPFIPLAAFFSRILTGMVLSDVSPEIAITNLSTPILFIHGGNDDFIPVWMAEELYARKNRGYRELYIAPDAKHAESYWSNPEKYANEVTEFLKKISVI